MTNKLNLNQLKDYKWTCEIWLPSNENKRFSGTITYNTRNGIHCTILGSGDSRLLRNEKVLHGFSIDLGMFSLAGCRYSGSSNICNSTQIYEAYIFVCYLVTGVSSVSDMAFSGCKFDFSYLRRMCRSEKSHKASNGLEVALLRAKYKDLNLSLRKFTPGLWINNSSIADNLVFYSSDDKLDLADIESRLNDCASKILDERVFLCFKTEDIFRMYLETDQNDCKLNLLCSHINKIVTLFSVLLVKPCFATEVNLLRKKTLDSGELIDEELPALISYQISNLEIESITSDDYSIFSDLNISDLKSKFQEVIDLWLEFVESPLDLTRNVILQYIRGDYNAAQQVVVTISAMEQWYHEHGDKSLPKYDFMIEKFLTKKLKDRLNMCIPMHYKKERSLGEKLSDIRGIVLHPNKARAFKFKADRSLDQVTLLNLSEILIVLLLRAFRNKFNLPNKDKLDDTLVEYEEIPTH